MGCTSGSRFQQWGFLMSAQVAEKSCCRGGKKDGNPGVSVPCSCQSFHSHPPCWQDLLWSLCGFATFSVGLLLLNPV